MYTHDFSTNQKLRYVLPPIRNWWPFCSAYKNKLSKWSDFQEKLIDIIITSNFYLNLKEKMKIVSWNLKLNSTHKLGRSLSHYKYHEYLFVQYDALSPLMVVILQQLIIKCSIPIVNVNFAWHISHIWQP